MFWKNRRRKKNEIFFERTNLSFLEAQKNHKYSTIPPLVSEKCINPSKWQIIASIVKISRLELKRLNIIDYGGANGGLYYELKEFIDDFDYSVIEQEHVVSSQKDNQNIKFFSQFEPKILCDPEKINIVVFSGVIQYLPIPNNILHKVNYYSGIKYVIFDRSFVLDEKKESSKFLTIQHNVDGSSYPAWFLTKNNIFGYFGLSNFIPYWDWTNSSVRVEGKVVGEVKGFLLERILSK